MARKLIFRLPVGVSPSTPGGGLSKELQIQFASKGRELKDVSVAVEDDGSRVVVSDIKRDKDFEIVANESTGRWDVYDLSYKRRDKSVLFTASKNETVFLKGVEEELKRDGFNRAQISEGKKAALEIVRGKTEEAFEVAVRCAVENNMKKFVNLHFRKLKIIDADYGVAGAIGTGKKPRC